MAKGVGGNKKLKFRTTEHTNMSKRRKILIAFISFTIIVAAISLTVLIREYDIFGSKPENGEVTSETNTKMKDEVNIIFAGVPTAEDGVAFLSYVTLNTEKQKITVCPVSPMEKYKSQSFSDIYAADGATALRDALVKSRKITIDRYVVVTEKKFKSFVSVLGLYEIDLKSPIDYQSAEFTLNLLAGKQKLNGDKLFKYIKYIGIGDSEYALKAQGEVIADFIAKELNSTNTEKGDDLFGTLMNNSHSDVTIIDFSKYRSLLLQMSESPRVTEVKLVSPESD